MIILGNCVVNPIYTRIIISRSCIYAEIAVSRFSLPTMVTPGTMFTHPNFGRLYVDSFVRQEENFIIRAYDPLAYYAKYTICKPDDSKASKPTHYPIEQGKTEDVSTNVIHDILVLNTVSARLTESKIRLEKTEQPGGTIIGVDIKYDILFTVYSTILEQKSPDCRLSIIPYTPASGNTVYIAEVGNKTPILLTSPMVNDYSYKATYPDRAMVAGESFGTERIIKKVKWDEGKRDLYVNANFTIEEALESVGRTAIAAAKTSSFNKTVKMLASNIPKDLKPADTVKFEDTPDETYRVQSIEYATSSRGDIAYISCGGKSMTVADRINAIIASDLAARY